MSTTIKFNRRYDVAILQEELQTCVQYSWTKHFNHKEYEGGWDCIALHSIDGKSETIVGFLVNSFLKPLFHTKIALVVV